MNVQPSIVLKKVETITNATEVTNNTITTSSSSSSVPTLPPAGSIAPLPNANPIVNAGQDQIITINDTGQQIVAVTLNGSATDPQNDSLVYRWNQLSGRLLNLSNPTSPQTQASIPIGTLVSGNNTFTFELSVYDNNNGMGNDTTTIQVLKNGTSSLRSSTVPPVATTGTQPIPGSTPQTPAMKNKPPNAEAIASPNSVDAGQQVALVGTGSNDEDGTISSFLWEQLDGRTVTLQNRDKSVASFTAPNEESTLEFKLTVTDNQGQADSTTIKVEVKGPDAESSGGEDITGSTSSNGDTDIEED